MKKLLFIPALLSIAILFTACGESRPDDLPVTLNASAEKSYELVASANNPQNPSVTFNLNDFSGVSQYKKWISSTEVTSTSYIEITGIVETDAVEMKDVTISLASDANKSLSLGTVTANEKFMIDSASRLNFMQAVMDEIVSKGSSNVVLKYTPATTMINPNAKLTIRMNTRFSFN